MDSAGVSAALAYVDTEEQKKVFTKQCKELEDEFKGEIDGASKSIRAYLGAKAAAKLSDGRVVRIRAKPKSLAITEERIRAAIAAVTNDEAVECGGVGKAAVLLLREQCTGTTDAIEVGHSEADLPAAAYPLRKAPETVERMCAQKAAAEAALKEVRKHKKEQKTKADAAVAALETAVKQSFEATTGCAVPPAKRPRSEAEAAPAPLPPPVSIAAPPEVTRPGEDEPTRLPMFGGAPLPPEVAVPTTAAAAAKTIKTHVPGMQGVVDVRVKESHTKGRTPSLKQFGPKLEKLLLSVDYRQFDRARDDYADRAVVLFDEIRAATAETRAKLQIKRKER